MGLDLQTQEAAEAVVVLGDSWGLGEAGRERGEEGEHDRSLLRRDAAKASRGAAASLLCLKGPERFWTVQQQDLWGTHNSYLRPSDS